MVRPTETQKAKDLRFAAATMTAVTHRRRTTDERCGRWGRRPGASGVATGLAYLSLNPSMTVKIQVSILAISFLDVLIPLHASNN
jgi:hypothetical protein